MTQNTAPNELVPAPTSTPSHTLVARVSDADIARLDAVAQECARLAATEMAPFRRTFLMAAAMRHLRAAITDAMLCDVMDLQGSPLGFLTDKDDAGGYALDVVKEVAIEATLRGLRLVGNEINIIGGRCYAAKNGLRRLVREWPGVADLHVEIHAPRVKDGVTVVPCRATWTLEGRRQVLDCTGERAIPVRVNQGMIVDAVLGKAERKLYARIYDLLCGSEQGLVEPDPPAEVDPAAPSSAAADGQPAGAEDPAEQYLAAIAASDTRSEVTAHMRRAGADEGLSRAARARVAAAATKRVAELRQQGPGSAPRQRDLIDTTPSATEAGF